MIEFSVVIPVYNVAPCLKRCLDSLRTAADKTMSCAEFICVDDGSTDGSSQILDEYRVKDARFVVVHQENQGASVARNVGIDHVRGIWLSFVDSDDVVSPDYFKAFECVPEKGDITFFPITFQWPTGVFKTVGLLEPKFVEGAEAVAKTIWHLVKNEADEDVFAYMVNKFIRADLIRENRVRFVQGLSLSEDEIFLFEVAKNAESVALMPASVYRYMVNHTGLSSSRNRPCMWLFELYRKIGDKDNRIDFKRAAYIRAYVLLQEAMIRQCSWAACKSYAAFSRTVVQYLTGGLPMFGFARRVARVPVRVGVAFCVLRLVVARLARIARKVASCFA